MVPVTTTVTYAISSAMTVSRCSRYVCPANGARVREFSGLLSFSEQFLSKLRDAVAKFAVLAFRDAMTLLLENRRQAVMLHP